MYDRIMEFKIGDKVSDHFDNANKVRKRKKTTRGKRRGRQQQRIGT